MARAGFTRGTTALFFLLILLAPACARPEPWSSPGAEQPSDVGQASPATRPLRPSTEQLQEAYGRIPLHFEENRGQADPSVRYLAQGRSYRLLLTNQDVVLQLGGDRVRMALVGASDRPRLAATDRLPGTVNYFTDPDRQRHRDR